MDHDCVCAGRQQEEVSYKDKEVESATRLWSTILKGLERLANMVELKKKAGPHGYHNKWQADENYIDALPSLLRAHGAPIVLLHPPGESPQLTVSKLNTLPSTPRPAHVLRKASYQSRRKGLVQDKHAFRADTKFSRSDPEKGFYYGHGTCEAKGES